MTSAEEKVAIQTSIILIKQQLTELSKEVQKWRSRVELARKQSNEPLANAAEERVEELTQKGRGLWKQLDDLQADQRFGALEIDEELEKLRREIRGIPEVEVTHED
jgi:phage shock protein A